MASGWTGEKVRLVPHEIERDIELAMSFVNDPEITQWLKMGDTPMSRLAEREYLEGRARNPGNDVSFTIVTIDGDRPIGFSGIHKIDHQHGTASTGTVIGDRESWGKGYGTDAAKVRACYAFEVLGLRLLRSSWFEGNVGSQRMLERAGYIPYGKLPNAIWKRGQYRDLNLVYLTREMWLATQATEAR